MFGRFSFYTIFGDLLCIFYLLCTYTYTYRQSTTRFSNCSRNAMSTLYASCLISLVCRMANDDFFFYNRQFIADNQITNNHSNHLKATIKSLERYIVFFITSWANSLSMVLSSSIFMILNQQNIDRKIFSIALLFSSL